MAWLTKSRFLAGLQCPKRLWSEIHAPLEESLPDQVNFINGRAVDELVQTLRPGVVISREQGMPAAIAETSRVIRTGASDVLYQPAFRSGEFAVIADVLRRQRNGYTLIEVKSSTSVKDIHIHDAAFQALVLRKAKIPVDVVCVAYVDNRFVLKSKGDYDGLIVEQDVTSLVEESLPAVADSAAQLLSVMNATQRPTISMGPQCASPYECPFVARCTAERGGAPAYPVNLLPRGGKVVQALTADGFEDLAAVPADRLTGEIHRRVHHATLTGEVFFDPSATNVLRAQPYPMAYLDFETIGFAVPEVVGTRPYEQLPFQYSLHVEDSPAEVRHAEFLALDSFGDFDALARALLAAVPDKGPVFAYNAGFERRVLLQLADRLPAQAAALLELAQRLVDLLPITRAAYYHRDMRGSWSIKAVLPTIAPELDYANLTEVQGGEGAQMAFLEARHTSTSPARREALQNALLAYCRQDTWAMIVLRKFLCGESR